MNEYFIYKYYNSYGPSSLLSRVYRINAVDGANFHRRQRVTRKTSKKRLRYA